MPVLALLAWSIAQQAAIAQSPARGIDSRNLQVQAVPAPAAQASHQRLALVIGNSSYKDAPLANPVNDARAIALALKESGFTVIARENVDQRGMLMALREFGDKLRSGGTGLFYFAGHGMQIKGRNYLIPVASNIEHEDEVAYGAVDAQAVLDKMEAAGNVANIMILDACRNNPFTRSMRSGQAGLAQMDAPVGTLVAYATSPGAVASDGAGANGLYTQHLLTAIRQPNSKVEDVFKQVRANVRRDSQGKQVPWESTSLEGDFYFRGGPQVAASPQPALAAQSGGLNASVETALWDAVKNSTIPVEVNAYLGRYPNGQFAAQARARLAALQGTAVSTQTAAAGAGATAPARPAPPLAAPVVPNKPQGDEWEDAKNRRTAELMKDLANAPASGAAKPAQTQVATASGAARPAPASNAAGFTVGDRWRFQVVDKFKKEVVRNYSRNLDRILDDGSIELNKGSLRFDSRGSTTFSKNATSESVWSGKYSLVPLVLRAGEKTPLEYEVARKYADGRQDKEVNKGTLLVVGQEQIKVPAGQFNAWRYEIDVWGRFEPGGAIFHWTYTGWYVPELRANVATEDMSRSSNGAINRFERHELTSFSVRGAENLALR